MEKFEMIEQLTAWLQNRGVDLAQWGQGQSKTVENLWEEISKGETTLQREPPLRLVEVTQVIVRRDEMILVESRQAFHSGRRRARGRPPSEKMRPGENYLDAALRCLKEELGITRANVRILPNTYRRTEHRALSDSYPGLRTHYTFHVIEAQVEGLPESSFHTEERVTGLEEPVQKHYWEWKRRA